MFLPQSYVDELSKHPTFTRTTLGDTGKMPEMPTKGVQDPSWKVWTNQIGELVDKVKANTPEGNVGIVPKGKRRGYASGGFVSLFNSGGPAMGTDTVPAMLTPGEFVVRKAAVDAVGIETLKSINGMGAGHTNNRGRKARGTGYFQEGGEATGGTNMYRLDSSSFTDAVGSFDSSVKRLEELFKGGIQMSHKIEDMNVIVSVNHNGEPADDAEMGRGMQRKIRREVSRGINSFIERQFPDMPRMDIEGTS